MALIQCPECKKEISDKAAVCPHCGCPISATNKSLSMNPVSKQGVAPRPQNVPVVRPTYQPTKVKKKRKRQNGKKTLGIVTVILVVLLLFVLIATHTICLFHDYSKATVLEPQTCDYCGKTQGEPKPLTEIDFPTVGVGALLPLPESNMGEVNWNHYDSFSMYVGNTTYDAYSIYINKCMEAGFNINFHQYEDSFSAYDSNGNDLNIDFRGNNIMEVYIHTTESSGTDSISDEEPVATNGNDIESVVKDESPTSTTIPVLLNDKTATETDIAYPVNPDMYLNLTKDEINIEFTFLRELMEFKTKHKYEALNEYLEMGDDGYSKLYVNGELFGMTGQYVLMYGDNDIVDDFGFHWVIDDFEVHANQIMHCLTTYFGEYDSSKEFYYGGVTYHQYRWVRTTDDVWWVHLSIQEDSGWLQITPVEPEKEEEKETYVVNGCFSITADDFADGFEDAFDGINGYKFEISAKVDETKTMFDVDNYLYYMIIDAKNYDRDVGILSFIKTNGKILHYTEEFSADIWNGINIMIERNEDVSATVVATVFAVDPSIGYYEAFDIAQNIVDNVSVYSGDVDELQSVEHNSIKYMLYREGKYHYLLVTALEE